MSDDKTTHEEVEAAYGPGSYEWIVAVKAEVERLRQDNASLRALINDTMTAAELTPEEARQLFGGSP